MFLERGVEWGHMRNGCLETTPIVVVNSYNYLGVIFTSLMPMMTDFKEKTASAQFTMNNLWKTYFMKYNAPLFPEQSVFELFSSLGIHYRWRAWKLSLIFLEESVWAPHKYSKLCMLFEGECEHYFHSGIVKSFHVFNERFVYARPLRKWLVCWMEVTGSS